MTTVQDSISREAQRLIGGSLDARKGSLAEQVAEQAQAVLRHSVIACISDAWSGEPIPYPWENEYSRGQFELAVNLLGFPSDQDTEQAILALYSEVKAAHPAQAAAKPLVTAMPCDGCNVREPFEHRCWGASCPCEECAEARRRFG